MKRILFIIIVSASAMSLSGQQIYLETGIVRSSFDYKNSDGNSLDNMHGEIHNFISVGFHTYSSVKRLNYFAGLQLNQYGAKGSDESVGNYFDWNVHYLGLELGADYELFKKRYTIRNLSDLTFYLRVSVTPEILISGTQTINNNVYNVVGIEQFKYPYLFARGGCGVSYSVSRTFSLFLQYMGGRGLPLKIGDREDKEKLRINSHTIGFGLSIDLPTFFVKK
jgi:hypothetical protein